MKVPKMYKSSDRYNAGTDVIYDDDSKLQYAPFIYATAESGDSGEGGDDEEGEDVMVVNIIWDATLSTYKLDKTWSEINTAMLSGKLVILKESEESTIALQVVLRAEESSILETTEYLVSAVGIDGNSSTEVVVYSSDSESGTLIVNNGGD